jgi:hypothetical protein
MGKLFTKRKKCLDFSPIQIEIGNIKFDIKWGENKEINLPVGKYKIEANTLFFLQR